MVDEAVTEVDDSLAKSDSWESELLEAENEMSDDEPITVVDAVETSSIEVLSSVEMPGVGEVEDPCSRTKTVPTKPVPVGSTVKVVAIVWVPENCMVIVV